MHPRSTLAPLLASSLLLAGCTATPAPRPVAVPAAATEAPRGFLRLRVSWPERTTQSIPVSTTRFRLVVTAPDLAQPLETMIYRPTAAAGGQTLQLSVPVGTGRSLRVEALTDAGRLLADGSVDGLSVVTGQYTPVTVTLANRVGDVTGTVRDPETGAPLAEVRVTCGDAAATSDASGSYRLSDLDPGLLTVTYARADYMGATQSVTVTAGTTTGATRTELVRRHWFEQISGTTSELWGVTALSATEAWACGRYGTLLHSTDGGQVWQLVPLTGVGPYDYVYRVRFATATIGYVATSVGLFRTVDGGTTWAKVPATMSGRGLEVFDASTVLVSGSSVRSTTDGGATATAAATNLTLSGLSAVSPSILFGYVGNTVYKTMSGGTSWSPTVAPSLDVGYSDLPNAVYAESADHCLVAGSYLSGGVRRQALAETLDGGGSWSYLYTGQAPGSTAYYGLRAVAPFGTGWCAVGVGGIAMQASASAAWQYVSLPSCALVDVHFVGTGVGWAVGEDGKILKYVP